MTEPTRAADTHANEDLLAALTDEFLRRHRACENPSVDEYAKRHPRLADEIRDLFPAMIAMEHPGIAATLDSAPPAERIGATIGRYKLLERIGEGGFGVVYMAEQVHPVRRKVALKVIKPGFDTKQVIARFEAERQALALMDHENIAKVLDAGATETARPYFVMELVHGVPITDFCDKNQLPPRDRLELFVQVCRAVQHAHTKGIIHRDIKPTNVLVTLHEGVPVPKVIDFGVAKATGQQLTEKTLFTNFAQMVGTPLYMSPEQAEMTSIDVDTRSDVYSLGVLLYELLTGTTPLDKDRLKRAAFDEVRRIIREEEPPRPSLRLSTLGDAARSISAVRKSDPHQLGRLVRGELDWIVMKALEKERSRRYETAIGLARDVERYLQDEPVSACPPSTGYRLRKFTRRYRGPLAVAAAFLSVLVTGTVVSTYQALRIRAEQKNTLAQEAAANRERERAVAAEQTARSEARKSEQVAAFMTEMLHGVGPSVALGRDTAMLREILDNASKRLDQLKDQPAVEAHLRTVLGGVHADLGDPASAESMFRAALAGRRSALGEKHVAVAKSLTDVGEALSQQGQWAEAERMLTEGLAMQRELLGDNHPAVALTVYRLGLLYNRQGRAAEAEPRFREAAAIYQQHPGSRIAEGVGMLGLSLAYQGKYSEAEPFMRESLAAHRDHAPAGSPVLATHIHNLGWLLREAGRLEEAEPLLREALEVRLKQLGELHPQVGVTRVVLAESLRRQRRYAEAEAMAEEALTTARRRSGVHHGSTVSPLYVLGRTRHDQGRLADAEASLREALAIAEEVSPNDWSTHSSRLALGRVLVARQKYGEAEPLLLLSYPHAKRQESGASGSGTLLLKETLQSLLRLYEDTGQTEEIGRWREELRKVERVATAAPPTSNPAVTIAPQVQSAP